jgi:phage-related minor tail protein
MALSTGSAYLDVVPKLVSGFGKILGDDVNPEMEKAGKEGGNKFSKSIGAAGIGAGAILGKEIYDSLDISAANDKLAAQLNLGTQAADTAGKAAANIYKGNWGDSIEDVDDSIAAVGSSLLNLNKASSPEIENLTEKALNLASAFDIEVSRSVNSAGILIKTGLARDANQAYDLITAALQGVPKEVREDILDASDEYSTYFKGLGFTGAQAFQLLKNASAGGAIQIDKAGDAIKEFSIRSTDMSTLSVSAYKAIGLNAKTMSNDILAGGDKAKGAFDKIVTGLLNIKDPTTQSNTAISLFGTQFEDIGVKNIPAFLQGLKGLGGGLTDVDGAADRFGKTLNDNAKSNVDGLIRTLKTDRWKPESPFFLQLRSTSGIGR